MKAQEMAHGREGLSGTFTSSHQAALRIMTQCVKSDTSWRTSTGIPTVLSDMEMLPYWYDHVKLRTVMQSGSLHACTSFVLKRSWKQGSWSLQELSSRAHQEKHQATVLKCQHLQLTRSASETAFRSWQHHQKILLQNSQHRRVLVVPWRAHLH